MCQEHEDIFQYSRRERQSKRRRKINVKSEQVTKTDTEGQKQGKGLEASEKLVEERDL